MSKKTYGLRYCSFNTGICHAHSLHSSYACTLLALSYAEFHCPSLSLTVIHCPTVWCAVLHCPALSCTVLHWPTSAVRHGLWTALYKFAGWDVAEYGWDVGELLDRLTFNAEVATVLGSIPASSGTVESEGRQMKQCWIKYIPKIPLLSLLYLSHIKT